MTLSDDTIAEDYIAKKSHRKSYLQKEETSTTSEKGNDSSLTDSQDLLSARSKEKLGIISPRITGLNRFEVWFKDGTVSCVPFTPNLSLTHLFSKLCITRGLNPEDYKLVDKESLEPIEIDNLLKELPTTEVLLLPKEEPNDENVTEEITSDSSPQVVRSADITHRSRSISTARNVRVKLTKPLHRGKHHNRKEEKPKSILKYQPIVIAQQLMLIENELLRRILTKEFLLGNWRRKDKEQLAPNIVAYISWFNKMTNWIISEIVTGLSTKKVIKRIEKFIEIGECALAINNLNTVMEIVSALNQGPIFRLKNISSSVSDKHKDLWLKLKQLMSPDGNYANARNLIKNWNNEEDKLPYIGLFLQDLLAFEEIPTYTTDNMINFQKMRKITTTIKSIKSFQYAIKLPLNETVRDYLISDDLTLLNEADQFVYSRLCESKKD